jgi:hypothetical protein
MTANHAVRILELQTSVNLERHFFRLQKGDPEITPIIYLRLFTTSIIVYLCQYLCKILVLQGIRAYKFIVLQGIRAA